MVSVSSFRLKHNKEGQYFSIITAEAVRCPYDGGELVYRDSVFRNVKNLSSENARFLLRRLRCLICNKTNRELPDIILPYKHYRADVIQAVLDGSEEAADCHADNSTIRRWKDAFADAGPDIAQRLASVYAVSSDENIPLKAADAILDGLKGSGPRWLPFVIGLLINNGHKICTGFAFCPISKSDKVDSTTKNIAERGQKNVKTIEDTS